MWMKTGPRRQKARNTGTANASRQTSGTVEEDKEIAVCDNRSARRTPANAKKLDKDKETVWQELVSREFTTALQACESGKVILNGVIIPKTQENVGCKVAQGQDQ